MGAVLKWRVVWTERALRDADHLDPQIRRRIIAAIDRYATDEHGDVLRLEAVEPPEWRLRIGAWRVRFATSVLLWYALGMTVPKRKVSVSLDEDLVEEFEREDQSLSAQLNSALREELERRRRNRLLIELLDRLDAEHGPVDESLIENYAGLLE